MSMMMIRMMAIMAWKIVLNLNVNDDDSESLLQDSSFEKYGSLFGDPKPMSVL